MRVMFVSLATAGHAFPMVPLAAAAREAGHEVWFAAGEAVHEALAAHGLRPFRPADAFHEIYPEDLEPELARLRPDLVVHGWGVPGAAVAARRAAIAGIWHGFGRMIPEGIGFELPTVVAADRAHLDICPPSVQDKDFVASAERIALRPVAYAEPGGRRDRAGRTARPLVYLTLGTVFGTAELLGAVIAGLAGLGADVVVATGRIAPERLGRLPDGVTASAWVRQAEVLPRADLVVHHGGSGTTLGALAA
ncbi:MAG TPA: nucleotide disphospho-sugar-binding domain-containing protein, partial [Pseudonocardiaceae bacterium]